MPVGWRAPGNHEMYTLGPGLASACLRERFGRQAWLTPRLRDRPYAVRTPVLKGDEINDG